MQVDILYVPQCPNLPAARSAVEAALAQLGVEATVREVEVTSLADAELLGMPGSPTILIDGRDPFAEGAEASVSCRLYRSEQRLVGAPSVDELVEVLSR